MVRPYISKHLRNAVRLAAQNRCGYCLSPQHLVLARLEIEHIIPLAKDGTSDESNLWLACPICNAHKGSQTSYVDPDTGQTVSLFDPRRQIWHDHFEWSEDGLRIVGRTATGRATVVALKLSDDPDALLVRSFWILAGWHPPSA
ncbi:MAG: HNH endonuclease [Chloroflexi bacterium]|nr:HNH endonuclease [Chloroflexota bacterium]